MSVRARSWVGAMSMLGAVLLLMAGGMNGGSLRVLIWPGAGLVIVGLVLVVSAIRHVSRAIGANQNRMEAMLRSEVEARRGEKKESS